LARINDAPNTTVAQEQRGIEKQKISFAAVLSLSPSPKASAVGEIFRTSVACGVENKTILDRTAKQYRW
jgi:hypothetical protein